MVTSWLPRRSEPHVARPQQPQPGLEFRFERIVAVGKGIVARAEQREIVGRDPFQKLDRFGDLVGRQRRRIGPQFGDDLAGARQHRPPILDGDAHVGEDVFERAHDHGPLRRIVDAFDMDVNEAFAAAAGLACPLEGDELSRLIALDGEDRMHQQADVEAHVRRARRAPNRPGTAYRH